ncbi:hypothetical protein BCJMU51_3475 [Bacillus cereus]|nr:hypothetical protein BCM0045_3445 [Bacillus cereus]BCC01392.1 hypothetical protein BCM0057_3474 [Bacillus cereus]BCC24901.1 hypothetical protein BCM0079_3494 [Bacillus cereus]BCC36475.1 hypothetical protein BCM0105_3465 [Bacillus cereus]BCC42277.1 hypothetical protein BCJMU01_3444 [Bacillus cereus]
MNVSLLTPTTDLQDEYLDFYNEWKDSGETMIRGLLQRTLLTSPLWCKNYSMHITE